MSKALTTIQKFMQSLDNTTLKGKNALDEAVRASSRFNSTDEWINSFTALVREYNTTNVNKYASENDFLKAISNIDLNNKDTGAITGLDAGGSIEKTAESVVPEPPRPTQNPVPGSSSSFQDLTIVWPTTGASGSGFTESEKTVMRGLQTWWIDESLSLLQQSFGSNFHGNKPTVKKVPISFIFDKNQNFLAYVQPVYTAGKTETLSMTINMANYDPLDPNNPNGYAPTKGETYLDRTTVHELTHAVMMARLGEPFHDLPWFIIEGLAELVHGIDDERKDLITELCKSPNRLAPAFAALTDKDAPDDVYPAGYMALRYLANNGDRPFTPTATQYIDPANSSKLIITSSSDDQLWLDGRDNITYAGINNFDARNASGSLILAGNTNANKIAGSNGSSSLWGGAGNVSDTLYGGNGGDSFFYGKGEGNDVIVNSKNIDKVMAYSPRFEYSMTNTSVNGDTLSISMNDGGSLTVLGWNEKYTFELADKTQWGYSVAANKWIQK